MVGPLTVAVSPPPHAAANAMTDKDAASNNLIIIPMHVCRVELKFLFIFLFRVLGHDEVLYVPGG